MKLPKRYLISFIICFFTVYAGLGETQAQDRLPVREYTNLDEVVTFDRSTNFDRAIDVINDFAQENLEKIIINRTDVSEPIGISVPTMHWRDALDLILRVKDLYLIETPEFYEIVATPPGQEGQPAQQAGTADGTGEEIVATTSTKEVRINAIFFEGNRSALRELGVDWSTLTPNVPENIDDFVGAEASEQLPDGEGTFEGPFVQVNSRGAQNVSQNVFNSLVNFGEIGGSGIRVQALFSAFEADNLGEIIASPSVRVQDGEEGRIQVGQEFSIKQRDFAGNVTDEFFDVGTILEVTPNVIEYSDTTIIHLELLAERSSAQPDPVSTIVNKTESTTQTLLIDGETTVIAGLYRTEENEVRRGIPVLKDLPPWFFGLRYLFGFTSEDYTVQELVILVQASIEPGIKERFAQRDSMADKFQVLENERNRVRDEIMQRDRGTSELVEEPLDEGGGEIDMEEEADTLRDETSPEEEAVPVQKEDPAEEELPEDVKDKEEISIIDPEIKQEVVKLDFNDEEKQDSVEIAVEEKEAKTTETEVEVEEEEQPDAEPAQEQFSYYVIAGSFQNENNATDLAENLVEEGFDSQVLQKPNSSFFFVAYSGHATLEEAQKALADVKEFEDNEGAWIYNAD